MLVSIRENGCPTQGSESLEDRLKAEPGRATKHIVHIWFVQFVNQTLFNSVEDQFDGGDVVDNDALFALCLNVCIELEVEIVARGLFRFQFRLLRLLRLLRFRLFDARLFFGRCLVFVFVVGGDHRGSGFSVGFMDIYTVAAPFPVEMHSQHYICRVISRIKKPEARSGWCEECT